MAQQSMSPQDSRPNLLSVWDKAFELSRLRLSPKELRGLDTKIQRPAFTHLLEGAKTASEIVERKRYPYTSSVQSRCPRRETSEKLVDSLDWIARMVFRADEYTRLFAHEEISTVAILQQLHDDLVELFKEVLLFLYRAMAHFQKSSPRRYISAAFKPFDRVFQGAYERISRCEMEVKDDIRLLNVELDILHQEVENGIWLRHAEVEFMADQDKHLKEHLAGTCEWFLGNYKVKNWMNASHITRLLWVSGKPGCGKSIMASQLIQNLSTSTPSVLRIFCKTGMENRGDLLSVLCNLIYLLLESPISDKRRLNSIITAQRMASKSPFASSIPQLWSALRRLLKCFNSFFCVIDGLDECNNTSEEVANFICLLTDTFNTCSTAKVIVFSLLQKPDGGDDTAWEYLSIGETDVVEDIESFALAKLNASPKLSKHRAKDSLLSTLVRGSEGMILWTRLMLSELENNNWNVDAVLQKPPKGLNAIYKGILQRLANKPEACDTYQHTIRLVLAASRPLHRDEFVLAIAMLQGLSDHEDYDLRCNPQDDALEIMNGVAPLITLLPNNTIQPVHASLKDFLLTPGHDFHPECNGFFFQPTELHGPVANALLSYVSFPCFGEYLLGSPIQIHSKYPLLEYSSRHLVWHITKVDEHSSECAEQLSTFLCSTQGWRWLERMETLYGVSIGHQQVIQAHLKRWIDKLPFKEVPDRDIFDGFLVQLNKKRLQVVQQRAGAESDTVAAMSSLARVYRYVGQWKEAEQLGVQVMEMRRWTEAEELEVQVIETRKNVLGEEHPDTLSSIANLASIYRNQGRWEKAKELQLQVMETSLKVLGEKHPYTLTSIGSLATTYRSQGRWAEAEELQVMVMEARMELLGLEHPQTLVIIGSLATTYRNQGRWTEAEKLEVQVLETRKRVLGLEHPYTLTSTGCLATIYANQGRWTEAEKLEKHVMTIRQRVLGQEHPHTLISIGSLATTYRNQGRLAEAEELEVQVMEIRKRVLGQDHPDTLTSIGSLASTYRSQGRWKKAEELEVHVMETSLRVHGQDHPDTLTAMHNLGCTFKPQGRIDEAIELMVKVVTLRTRTLGKDHPYSKNSVDILRQWRDEVSNEKTYQGDV
ncbi:hypothetical protein BDD12DRAFT_893306 [Trichophaea hybrida]|nr:hypothetical protein BDD12DRAFT_893306 [Trichophaea hybrida]